MRIISQDECFDVPYEKAILHIFNYKDEYEIGAFSIDTIDDGEAYIRMARYFTKEKAIKAMEMCAENYGACEYNKSALSALAGDVGELPDKLAKIFKDEISKKYIFRFPKDEEVEV